MYRAFLTRDDHGRVLLPREERHHLIGVKRARPGSRFLGFLEGEGWYLCELYQERKQWVPRLIEPFETSMESPLRITLGQALIKKARFEWILQKAIELGVTEFVPLLTARTEIRLDGSRASRKQARWDKIIRETVKQCGRDTIPVVHPPKELGLALSEFSCDFNLMLDEAATSGLAGVLERFTTDSRDRLPQPRSILLLVGPEGGWDERDRAVLAESNCAVEAARMGPRVMRSETAPLAALSLLQFLFGDLGAASGPSAAE